jgi:hypothetical protein
VVAPLALALAAACSGDGGSSPAAKNPAPAVATIDPDTVVRGSGEATISVGGTSFVAQSVGRFNGADRPTDLVSATALRVHLTAADLSAAGTAQVSVFTPAPGGGASGAAALVIANPPPHVTSISVNTLEVGSAGATVTVTGSNFFPETNASTSRGRFPAVTYVSPTQLRVTLTADDLKDPVPLILYIANPAPGGGSDNSTAIEVVNPAPIVTAISPTAVNIEQTARVTLTGSRFATGSVVYIGSDAKIPVFSSATQRQVDLSPTDVMASGTLSFRVWNPGPGGGFSSTFTLDVVAAPPVITSLLDTSTAAGQPSFPLAVNGTGFAANSVIRLNGVPRPTTWSDHFTQLQTTLTAEDLATPTTFTVTVTTPAPGGGTSNAVSFTVNPVP